MPAKILASRHQALVFIVIPYFKIKVHVRVITAIIIIMITSEPLILAAYTPIGI